MTVFKGYLRGALREKYVILLYLVIFLGLGILMTQSMDESGTNSYAAEHLTMTVVDRDKSTLSKALTDYLGETQDLVDLPDDRETLTEELYYGNIRYVLVIPEGFEEHFVNENAKSGAESAESTAESTDRAADSAYDLQGTGRPGSTESRYATELADGYLSGVKMYLGNGYSADEAVKRMKELKTSGATTVLTEGARSMSRVAGTLRFLPYIVVALSCYIIGFIMLDYQNPDIKNRLAVSAVSSASRTLQMLLAILVIGVLFFAVSIGMTALMNPTTILDEPNREYYLLNIALIVLVGLSIGFFVVQVARSGNGINGLANAIALGMSFFCGVFIPDTMLSSSAKSIAKYMPVYWYEQNNTILGTHSVLTDGLLTRLTRGYLLQLLCAGVILALSLVIGRIRDK